MNYEANKVYYLTKLRKFVQIKAITMTGFKCGGFCNYYTDSQTDISRQTLSKAFLNRQKPILVSNIDQVDSQVRHDGIGWRYMERGEKRVRV